MTFRAWFTRFAKQTARATGQPTAFLLATLIIVVWLATGSVPTAPYATPSTEEVPRSIAPLLEKHEAILLERHGSLTFGRDLREAYMRLEKLEQAAHTLFYARLLGNAIPSPLTEEAMRKLEQLGDPKG